MATGTFKFETAFSNRKVSSMQSVTKFGRNNDVDTSFEPVALGGIYRTPHVSAATKLRIKAGNTNDTANGSGARAITLEYTDILGNRVIETLATDGTNASAATSQNAIRLDRFSVAESGTYANTTTGSHVGNIVIENEAGTEDWGTISATGFARSQSEIGFYCVPTKKVAYITSFNLSEISNKVINLIFFQRPNILQDSAPYSAMRELFSLSTESGFINSNFDPFLGPIEGPADIGCLVSSEQANAVIEVNFNILLIDI